MVTLMTQEQELSTPSYREMTMEQAYKLAKMAVSTKPRSSVWMAS